MKMKRDERQKSTIDATMRLVYNKGFYDFSMNEVATNVDISGVLIYRDFTSRENLMISCYQLVADEFKAFSQALHMPKETDLEIKMSILRYIYYSYMKFLVRLDYKLIFFMDLLHTPQFSASKQAFKDRLTSLVREEVGVTEDLNDDFLWHIVMWQPCEIARAIIRQEMPDHDDVYEQTWTLLKGQLMPYIV